MLLNCSAGEDSWESLGLQGDQTSQSILKEINPEYSLEGLMLKLKLHIVRAMVFPVVMYECESWTIKKAEQLQHQNSPSSWKDWCWSFNILGTWCEETAHWERPWSWQGLKAGWEGGDRGWDGWMASSSQWPWVWANSGDGKRQGR